MLFRALLPPWHLSLALFVVVAFGVCVAFAGAATGTAPTPPATLSSTLQKRDFVQGELIVRFKPSLREAARASILRDEGVTLDERLSLPGTVVVKLATGASVPAAVQDFERHGDVLYAEPNYLYQIDPAAYLDNTETYLEMTSPVNLTGQSGCAVDYQLNLATEFEFDFFTIEGSLNRAAWSPVAGWTGSSQGAFVPLSSDLSAFDGQPSVFLRLGLESDEIFVDDGAYVDDLMLRCLNAGGDAYDSFSGTSMATPHVAGVAALYKAANPTATATDIKSAILNNVDTLGSLSGLLATGGRLNACRTLTADCAPPPPPTPQTPNDTHYPQLWGLNQASDADIDASEAWGYEIGEQSVIVAVVDSGVAYQHPDIAPNMWSGIGYDFVQEDATPYDYNGHGTHVAGTIGAQGDNALGVTGVNWDVSIMALRAGDASGSLETTDIVQAFNYACANGAHIVNGSFGGTGISQTIYNALSACPGALFVFAAGNDGEDNDLFPHYPCNYHRPGDYGAGAPNVVCVAATDDLDDLAGFSNYGDESVHLAAPGQGILSSVPAYQGVSSDNFETALPGRWEPRVISGLPWGRTSERSASGAFSVADSPVEASSPPPPTPPLPTLPPPQSPPPSPQPPPPPPSLPVRPPALVRCVVPNVQGKTLRAARTALTRRRCRLGRVTRAYSARVRRGKIIRQSRRPGARLPRGTRVNVVVSRGRRR
jgi:subtilisin family serine protease